MGLFSKKKSNNGISRKHVTPLYLDGIVKGLNYVANCASAMSLSHYQNLIAQYFEYDEENESYSPKTVRINIDDENEIIFPLVAVTDAKGLYLDELEVDFSVKVSGVDVDAFQDRLKDDYPRLIVDVAPRSDHSKKRSNDIVDFKVKFKSSDAPESIMRVVDQFNSGISPVNISRESVAPDDENITDS